MSTEAITEPMPAAEPPATVTIRRSWAVSAALLVAAVIVAMAIALAAVAGDGGRPDGGGFPPARSGATPQTGEGYGPPGGMPGPGTAPDGATPDLPAPGAQSSPNGGGSSSG